MPRQNQGSVKGRRIVLALAILIAAGVAYACWPRQADLRAFDPVEMARLETAMWRDYYEKHYPRLLYHLYESSRTQFGFSPLASVRISLSAALAAKTFQPTRSRTEAEAAISYLVTYYGLLRQAAPVRLIRSSSRPSSSTGGRRGARILGRVTMAQRARRWPRSPTASVKTIRRCLLLASAERKQWLIAMRVGRRSRRGIGRLSRCRCAAPMNSSGRPSAARRGKEKARDNARAFDPQIVVRSVLRDHRTGPVEAIDQ
jgi:hypothetical protein